MNWRMFFAMLALVVITVLVIATMLAVGTVLSQAPDPTKEVVGLLFGDGTWATVTPQPTPTISRTPANTPVPTNTVVPTTVPTLTPTLAVPTPTPETTPLPPPGCWGTTTTRLNYRPFPGTNNNPLGTWDAGQTLEITLIQEIPDRDFVNVWGYTIDPITNKQGYAAINYLGFEYMQLPDSQACQDVRVHTVGLTWHTTPGFNIGNARISHSILKDKLIPFGYRNYADIQYTVETLENGGIGAYRQPNNDCPQNIGTADPRSSAQDWFNRFGAAVCRQIGHYHQAYYEPTNECYFGDDQNTDIYIWWADWMNAYLDEWYGYEYPCPTLILPTPGPGHGSTLQYAYWVGPLGRMAANGDVMGEHAYQPQLNAEGNYNLCPCDEWLACRHRKNEGYRQSVGVDIDVAITEAARGWGGNPVSVGDFECWYEEIRHDEWVRFVSLWNLGPHPFWIQANLDNYVVPIAQAVAPAIYKVVRQAAEYQLVDKG